MANQGLRARLVRLIARIFNPASGPGRRPHGRSYTGDFRGTPMVRYRPNPGNGTVADPGEIVWTWVPFEEDCSLGKP